MKCWGSCRVGPIKKGLCLRKHATQGMPQQLMGLTQKDAHPSALGDVDDGLRMLEVSFRIEFTHHFGNCFKLLSLSFCSISRGHMA